MITAWRSFWTQRTLRERRLLLVMFALLGLFALWFGVVRPLAAARLRAEARLAAAATDAGIINARADALAAVRASARPRTSEPLPALVARSASAAGFTLARNDAAGGRTTQVTVAAARAPALFAWLTQLEAAGVVVDALAIRPNPDGSLAADATLRARGP